MKTNVLDLNAYGVEEMSVAEMHETEGGSWLAFGIAVGVILLLGAIAACQNGGIYINDTHIEPCFC